MTRVTEALEETQTLLAAMLHEDRPRAEIQAQMLTNRAALAAMPAPRPVAGDLVSREAAIAVVHEFHMDLIEHGIRAQNNDDRLQERLRALPAASQWRDMASAPKDGVMCLVRCNWGESLARFCANWLANGDAWVERGAFVVHPIAWMPLPAPSSVEEGMDR